MSGLEESGLMTKRKMIRVLIFDENGKDISTEIQTRGSKGGPGWSSCEIVRKIQGEDVGFEVIGSQSCGHIVLHEPYTFKEIEVEDTEGRND